MTEVPILYSTGCPKCSVLEKKLLSKHIPFEICNDEGVMRNLGFDFLPVLCVEGLYLDFAEANNWINEQEI